MNHKDHFVTVLVCTIVAIFLASCSTAGTLQLFEPMPPMVDEKEEPVIEEIIPQQITWGITAGDFNGKIGQRFTIEIPPGGEPHVIWGTAI